MEGQEGLDPPLASPQLHGSKHSLLRKIALRKSTGLSHLGTLLTCRVFGFLHESPKYKIPTIKVGTLFGGPGYTFLKPSEVDKLVEDLVLLHARLVELCVEYRNGEVYLADLEGRDV